MSSVNKIVCDHCGGELTDIHENKSVHMQGTTGHFMLRMGSGHNAKRTNIDRCDFCDINCFYRWIDNRLKLLTPDVLGEQKEEEITGIPKDWEGQIGHYSISPAKDCWMATVLGVDAWGETFGEALANISIRIKILSGCQTMAVDPIGAKLSGGDFYLKPAGSPEQKRAFYNWCQSVKEQSDALEEVERL
jgi:hypothetical protein